MKSLRQNMTMLVGIDVTHPGPGSVRGTPSIAAVVASVDGNYAQFPASMEIQESKKEVAFVLTLFGIHILIRFKLCQMVTNLEKMMVERLTLFRLRSDNKLPGRILVYRDGVSEVGSTCLSLLKRHVKLCSALQGQFLTVVGEELPAIKAAFRKFNTPKAPYQPKLTIVICVSTFYIWEWSSLNLYRVNATTRVFIPQIPKMRMEMGIPRQEPLLTEE